LRASASEILTEQTIGRGLRLPFGKRTGVEALDRLIIVSHDQFHKIVDRANDPNSLIHKKIEIGENGDIENKDYENTEVRSVVDEWILSNSRSQSTEAKNTPVAQEPVLFDTEQKQEIAKVTLEVLKQYEYLPSTQALKSSEVQQKIVRQVSERVRPLQQSLLETQEMLTQQVKNVVEAVTEKLVETYIDIPKITVFPKETSVTYGFHDFDLQGLETIHYQPVSQEILLKALRTNKSSFLNRSGSIFVREERLEQYVLRGLFNEDIVDYETHAVLLNKLAGQMVNRLKEYLKTNEEIESALMFNQSQITDFIVSQLRRHQWETPAEYDSKLSKGFIMLRPFACNQEKGTTPISFRIIPDQKNAVKRLLFTGFSKSCYPYQRFDSVDGELRFSHILEDDPEVLKWMKPSSGFFQIEYRNGQKYEPDFVVETKNGFYICEPKRVGEMEDSKVLEKKKAALEWCKLANKHAEECNSKRWQYVLIPHDAILSSRSFMGLVNEFLTMPSLLEEL
jgi:type III restriction enzyme